MIETLDPWIVEYIRKAKDNQDEAGVCIARDLPRAAISRAYYSLYQAANAWMKHQGYSGIEGDRDNWHHEAVNRQWKKIVRDLQRLGVSAADDRDSRLYNRMYSYRVRVDYKAESDPTRHEARLVVTACEAAVGWLLEGLGKEGYR